MSDLVRFGATLASLRRGRGGNDQDLDLRPKTYPRPRSFIIYPRRTPLGTSIRSRPRIPNGVGGFFLLPIGFCKVPIFDQALRLKASRAVPVGRPRPRIEPCHARSVLSPEGSINKQALPFRRRKAHVHLWSTFSWPQWGGADRVVCPLLSLRGPLLVVSETHVLVTSCTAEVSIVTTLSRTPVCSGRCLGVYKLVNKTKNNALEMKKTEKKVMSSSTDPAPPMTLYRQLPVVF